LKELTQIFPSLLYTVGVRQAQAAWLWWLLSYAAVLRCSGTARLLWSGVKLEHESSGSEPRSVRFSLLVGEDGYLVFKRHASSVEFHLVKQLDKQAQLCPASMLWQWYLESTKRGWQNEGKVFGITADQPRKLFQSAAASSLQMTERERERERV
jgi:hypothetical protein